MSPPTAAGGPLRVFAALPLPAEALARLERAGEELRRRSREFRVVRPEGMHVTLFFFGELAPERVSAVERGLDDPALAVSPVEASLGGLGQFPPRGAPRVLYCPIRRGSGEIAELHRRLRGALLTAWTEGSGQAAGTGDGTAGAAVRAGRADEGPRPRWDDPRPFTPHVTVARSRMRPVREALTGLGDLFDFEQAVTLDRVVLFQSILSPEGAEYRALKTVRLSGGSS